MNTYIICSDTNYDLMVHIVNAKDKKEAERIALENGAWSGCRVIEIDTEKDGLVFIE